MNNTIKLTVLAASLFGASSLWAATLLTDGASDVKTQVTAGVGGNCEALNETIAVKQSKNVSAAYTCGPTHVGLGTANAKGRGKYYQIHSGGGNPLEQDSVAATGTGTPKKYKTQGEANTDASSGADAAYAKATSAT